MTTSTTTTTSTNTTATRSLPGFCTLCRSRCGTLNHVENDHLIRVEALPGHPTGRATCAKGRAAPEIIESPERILYPLKRTRPKGETDPGWQRIGWDEALDTIAERLGDYRERHGAESVAFSVTTPSGTPMSDSIEWVERFIRLYGSPNTLYGTEICNWHKDVAHRFTFGCGMPTADYANAKLNILWGHNPSHVWLSQAGEIAEGSLNGSKLLVIDPRATPLAKRADLWLPIRPGTDGALALAIAHALISAGDIDEPFVRHWSNAPFLVDDNTGRFLTTADGNFLIWNQRLQTTIAVDTREALPAELADAAALEGHYRIAHPDGTSQSCHPAFQDYRQRCAQWPLARAARVTGLSVESIAAAAELIAEAGAAVSYHAWTGVGQHTNATLTERALATLYALTGSFDRVGGNRRWTQPPTQSVNALSLLDENQRQKALGLHDRPLGPAASGWITAEALYQAVETGIPYRPRALFGFGGNFLVSQPEPARGERALASLEFHVHCDLFHSPTNAYADILLPVSTPWEREGLRVGFEISDEASSRIQLRPAMVTPRGEARADYDIAFALATRLDLSEAFFSGDVDQGWNYLLAPSGIDVDTLRRHPEGIQIALDQHPIGYAFRDSENRCRGFETPTRRVEFYSQQLLDAGYPAVPQFVPPRSIARPDLPLTLITVKNGLYCHSQQRQIASLRRRAPEPTMTISKTLASNRGLEDGGWGVLCGENGEITLRVRVDATLDDEWVVTDYGWWQACDDLGRPASPIHGPDSQNINAIISGRHRDSLSGALPLRSAPCDIKVDTTGTTTWSGYRRMRISAKRRESPDVISIWLTPVDGGRLPDYLPGQHVTIAIDVDGESHHRSYSLSDAANAGGHAHYRISVKQAFTDIDTAVDTGFPGSISYHLHYHIDVGGEVDMRMPDGRFTLPRRHRSPVVLIAGGIGITPFLSLLETLARDEADDMPDVTLLYANRNGRSHAFRERLKTLRQRLPKLRLVTFYSSPDAEDRDYDETGRIDSARLDRLVPTPDVRIYLCAAPSMMAEIKRHLQHRGIPAQSIFSEAFLSPPRVATSAQSPRRVRLARSQHEFVWHPEHGSLLDSAHRQGIELPSGCRVGQCESCAMGLIEGQIDAPANELGDDRCLTCQAIPLTDLILDG